MSATDDEEADRAFEQRARAELRRRLEQTPPELRARLDHVVDRALQEPPRRSQALRFGLSMGVAAVIASIIVVQQMRIPDAPAARPAAAADDLALLLNADLDLLEQMEFYQWLDQHPGAADGVATPPSDEAQRS